MLPFFICLVCTETSRTLFFRIVPIIGPRQTHQHTLKHAFEFWPLFSCHHGNLINVGQGGDTEALAFEKWRLDFSFSGFAVFKLLMDCLTWIILAAAVARLDGGM